MTGLRPSTLSLSFALLFWACSALALGNECEVHIQVNDAKAKIFVDDHELRNAPPLILGCKETIQQIRVVSSDDQVFSRALPATGSDGAQKQAWNVIFSRRSSRSDSSRPTVSHVQVASADQSKVFTELAELRRLVNEIYVQRPELRSALAKSSVGRQPTAVVRHGVLHGAYVQLHALAKGEANMTEVSEELASRPVAFLAGSGLILCQWKDQNFSKSWTRVLVGPFKKPSSAKNIAKLIGRDTFVVREPSCSSD